MYQNLNSKLSNFERIGQIYIDIYHTITDPNSWDAFSIAALKFISWTFTANTIDLIITIWTVLKNRHETLFLKFSLLIEIKTEIYRPQFYLNSVASF